MLPNRQNKLFTFKYMKKDGTTSSIVITGTSFMAAYTKYLIVVPSLTDIVNVTSAVI